MNTLRLALLLLRTDASAYCRQRRTLGYDRCGFLYLTLLQCLDKLRYGNMHGATLYASRRLAVQASVCLGNSLFGSKPLVDLGVQRADTLLGRQLVHMYTRDGDTVFCRTRKRSGGQVVACPMADTLVCRYGFCGCCRGTIGLCKVCFVGGFLLLYTNAVAREVRRSPLCGHRTPTRRHRQSVSHRLPSHGNRRTYPSRPP